MCDSLVAVASETAVGCTLFAKNSDRKAEECQPFVQFPASTHPPGSTVRCTHIEIPQVAETYRVMGHSPWWIFGFEHGVNGNPVQFHPAGAVTDWNVRRPAGTSVSENEPLVMAVVPVFVTTCV